MSELSDSLLARTQFAFKVGFHFLVPAAMAMSRAGPQGLASPATKLPQPRGAAFKLFERIALKSSAWHAPGQHHPHRPRHQTGQVQRFVHRRHLFAEQA